MKQTLLLLTLTLLAGRGFSQNADSLLATIQVDSLIKVSRALTGNQDFDKALEVNAVAEKLALEKLGRETAAYGSCCFNHGRVLFIKGDYQESEKWYLEAKAIREKVLGKMHPDYAWCLNNLANLYLTIGKTEEAEQLHLEAKAIRGQVLGKEHPEYSASLNNLGVLYMKMGNYTAAEPLYKESRDIFEKVLGKEHPFYASCLINLALIYFETANYEKAEPLNLEAKSITEKVFGKEHPEYAKCINNLAILYFHMADFEKAELLYLEAIAIQKEKLGMDHPDCAGTITNLADLYMEIGNYEKAELNYIESSAIFERALGKAHPEYARSLRCLANFYHKVGNFEKAELLYIESILLLEKALGKEHRNYIIPVANLANLYKDMGRFEKAEPLYLECIALNEKTAGKENPDYAGLIGNLALLYHIMYNYIKAEPLYLEALAICEKTQGKEHPDYQASLLNLAGLYMDMGDYQKAEPLIYESSELRRSLMIKALHHLSEREMNKYLLSFSIEEARIPTLAQLTTSPEASGSIAGGICYDNILFYKGFLLHAANQVKRLALADSTTREKFNLLKFCYRRLATEYSKPILVQENIPELEEQANTLEKDLARTVAGYAEAMRQVKWQEVQQKLKPDEAAMEFVHYRFYIRNPTDTMYAAILLRPDGKQPVFIPLFEENQLDSLLRGGDIATKANLLYAARGVNPVYKKNVFSKNLYDLIWKPLTAALKGVKTVYFSPSGQLNKLNLGAIPIGKGEMLADHYNLVELSSTRQLVIPADVKIKNNNALLFGGIQYEMDSTAVNLANAGLKVNEALASRGGLNFSQTDSTLRGGNWGYLPGTEKEVVEVGKIIQTNGFKIETRQGHAATEEVFKHISSPSPRIMHIATHGFFFPDPKITVDGGRWTVNGEEPIFKISDNPLIRSGLILAGASHAWQTGKPLKPDMEDGILTAYEISQMNLSNTELVVLSACETGLGDIQGNEGVYGLQRAFKIAGAKYLIMSLWQVPDKQTSLLMTAFYKKWLEEKMAIPEAFRAAQKELREAGLDPYQWAGFVLVE